MDDVVIGVGIGAAQDGFSTPAQLYRYVERADDLGIDSIWMPDLPIGSRPTLDATVLLSVIAARTSDIKMGPSVVTLPGRNPISVAHTYATLAHLTGDRGRVILAVGLGADPRFAAAVDVPADERAARLREAVEILRRLWTEDDVTYRGEYYRVDGVTVEPKPADGALDVWIGGTSDAALRRVAAYGDGWFPAGITPRTFAAKQDRLQRYCEEAGRTVERDEAGMILPCYLHEHAERVAAVRERYFEDLERDHPPEAIAAYTAFGSPGEGIETIRAYVDAGCSKFVLRPVGPAEDAVAQLETYARSVIPAVT